MKRDYNTIYFTREHIEAGILNDFLLFMYKYSINSSIYADIHIKQIDFGELEVEWVYTSKDESWGGSFEYVGEDQIVLNRVIFPDNHYEYLTNREAEFAVEDWAKENNYIKNNFGQWEKKEENIDIIKEDIEE